MKKKLLKRFSAFLNISLVVLLLIPNFVASASVFAVDSVFPSTNEINKTNGWAYVNEQSKVPGSTTFEFKSTRDFFSCFEYRTDGDVSQIVAENDGKNYNAEITDGLYPYVCVKNNMKSKVINANQYIEIRLSFGAEKDERFTWTRFNVLPVVPPPTVPVLEYPINGVIINDNTPLMQWADSNGDISHYMYRIFFNCKDSSNIPGSCSVFPNLNGLRRNTSEYQAGVTADRVYHWQVKAVNNQGLESAWSELETFTIDSTPPSVPTGLYWRTVDDSKIVECGGYSSSRHLAAHWDAIVGDPTFSHYEYSSFNAPNGSAGLVERVFYENFFDSSSFWTVPIQGTYGYQLRSVDKVGNKSAWALGNIVGIENACRITIDWTAPVVEITSPLADTYVKGTVDFRGTVNEPSLLRYWYRILNLETNTAVHSNTVYANTGFDNKLIYTWDTTKNSDGVYEMRLDARDKALNKTNDSIDTIYVTVDNTAPTGEILGIRYDNTRNGNIVDVANFITNDRSPLIYGTYGDNYEVDTVEVKIGEISGAVLLDDSGNWTAQFPDLADRTYNISLKITDKAGNETELTQEIVIDSVAPRATYTHYIDGEVFEGDIAEVKSLSQLSFTASYTDADPSSGLKYDSFAIFQAQDDGSFRFSANGKKAYCSWRRAPNLVDLSGTTYELTEQIPFTNCIAALPDGEYYMAHHVYDNAVRKDIPTIMQFRDVLGLHFKIKNTPVVTITSPYTEVVQGALSFTIEALATDGNAPLTYEWTGPNGVFSTDSSFVFSPTTVGAHTFTVKVTDIDGDYDEDTIIITVKEPVNEPPQNPPVENPDNPGVLGTTTTTKTVKATPRNRTLYAVNVLDTSSEVTEKEESSDEIKEDTPEVLGEEEASCKVKKPLSGYVYVDKNKNDIKDKNEKVFENIKIKVTTKEDGKEKIVEEFTTDVKGEWRTTLCPGRYNITIDTTTIPKGYKLNGDSTVEVNILDNSERLVQPFHLSETKSFIQKYWWILLLIILLLTGLVVSKSKKENE